MKDISQCKCALTWRWRHYFEIALFSVRTLKTASQKQRYLCQKFLLPIPIHTWKISWIEWLIYLLRPHMANWSCLTLMWKSSACHGIVFIISCCFCPSHSIPGVQKKSIRSPIRKKRTSIQLFDLTVRKKFASVQLLDPAVRKSLHQFSCLT